MDNNQVIHELRQLYPSTPIQWFMQILRRVGLGDPQRLREELGASEQQTLRWLRRQQKKEERRAATAVNLLKRLEKHRGLRLDMSLPVSHTHVQLILVYGFAKLGSKVIFAGRHTLKPDSVRQNVARKLNQLGMHLNRDVFSTTLAFLIRHGVVASNLGKDGALSLNVDEHAPGVTETGRKIIQEVKWFFHGRLRS
ncbi:MAG: hypothetical protein HYT40_02050 [Candidatus Sungbacteria bacterium]|uniref:Uncharacterized protein n=1 Tax=Candidatus Sungiibacteriota bacterium TaxID=2750080 RepID=A0A931SCN7_9BACT|nr:hypothetical protein [Candidatus Sungbacteria bacterium]